MCTFAKYSSARFIQEFEAQLAAARAEEAVQRKRASAAEAQLAAEERELTELRAAAEELSNAEQCYWHQFNDFQMRLRAHVEERDAILRRVSHHFRRKKQCC